MKVIIPAAGIGKRMRPFTHTKPKPLLPVAGKPAISHIMERILPLGPTEICCITGHLGDIFEREMRRLYGSSVKLSFVEQPQPPKGIAQAIWLGRHTFEEDVLIVFSDTLFDADLSVIEKCEDDGIFWGMEVEDPDRFGVMVTDKSGHLARIVEKPKQFVSNLANIGLYYLKNTDLLLAGLEHALAGIGESEKEIYHIDAFAWMLERGARIKVSEAQGWYDTGTVEATLATNKILLAGESFIDPSARVVDSQIGEGVHLGANVEVRASRLSNCIVDAHSVIEDCELSESILGEHALVRGCKGRAVLGDHSEVSGKRK